MVGIEHHSFPLLQCFYSIHIIEQSKDSKCLSKRSGSHLDTNSNTVSATVTIIIRMPIVPRCFCNLLIVFGKWANNIHMHSNSMSISSLQFWIICIPVDLAHFYATLNVNVYKKVRREIKFFANISWVPYLFLFDIFSDLKHKTVSLWSFINASTEQYRNPLYGGRHSSIETVLKPIASMRHIRLWKGLYCRWNPTQRAQDPVYQRTRELLALQEQLQKQYDEYRSEKNQKSTNQGCRLASPLH